MATWIALFRGINVGGNNLLPMKELTHLLEETGCAAVRTYIQSGNAVFQSRETDRQVLSKKIEKTVTDARGFQPRVLLLTPKDLEKAVTSNPFKKAEASPKTLHVWFLSERPRQDGLKLLDSLRSTGEEFVLKGNLFYLQAPLGIGKSKLAARVEKSLGVSGTARNWNTITQLAEMARQTDAGPPRKGLRKPSRA